MPLRAASASPDPCNIEFSSRIDTSVTIMKWVRAKYAIARLMGGVARIARHRIANADSRILDEDAVGKISRRRYLNDLLHALFDDFHVCLVLQPRSGKIEWLGVPCERVGET